jgi:hypothetical protein
VPEGAYGIKADDTALGTPTLEKYAPGYTWSANTVVRTVASNTIPYPTGTTVVAGQEAAGEANAGPVGSSYGRPSQTSAKGARRSERSRRKLGRKRS